MGGLLTANGGISTTAISTNSAYIGALRVGGATNTGNLAVSGSIAGNTGLTITGGTTSVTVFTASGGATIDATSTNIISSGSVYAGSIFYSVASY
jgi:hypothetical protein